MDLTGNLFSACILLFLLAAASSLVFMKRQKLCNIISNIICMLASLCGAAAALIKLFTGSGTISMDLFKSVVPFITMDIKIDELSAFFILILSVLVFCVSLYSIGYITHYIGKRNVGLFNFLYSTFIISMIFVFISSNIIFFYIAWEAMALISYFLVIFESDEKENKKAGILYIVMTHISTAFLLIGFMISYSYTKSFDIFGSTEALPDNVKNIVFIMFLIGFGTKVGMIPLHIWLPRAYPAAPGNVSALMSGVMSKTAVYGLIRFVLFYLKVDDTWWGITILCLGVISTVLGVAYAFVEQNVKRLLAFCSIENIGIILIGIGVSFIAFSKDNSFIGTLALIAALLHALNHTLAKGGFFLGAGAIEYSTHTLDIEKLGGLIKKMPITALLVLCFSLSISAIVPFNGFISEWLTYQSLFAGLLPGQALQNILIILSIAALALSGALAVGGFVKLFGISFLGRPRSEEASKSRPVHKAMDAGMGILAVLCLYIGLFPLTIIKLIDNVAASISGSSIFGQFQGGALFAYYPIEVSGMRISPLTVALALACIIIITLIIIRLVGGKYIERKYGTWDCGFVALNSRMQYSATGYSKPVKIIFKLLFRPSRNIKTTGELPYHPQTIEYTTSSESIFEKYLYSPIYNKIKKFSRKAKFIVQTGSIHSYLLYIFVTVVVLMAYNMFS